VLRLRYSESMGTALQPTIDALQFDRVDTLARLFEMDLTELTRASLLPKQAGVSSIRINGPPTIPSKALNPGEDAQAES